MLGTQNIAWNELLVIFSMEVKCTLELMVLKIINLSGAAWARIDHFNWRDRRIQELIILIEETEEHRTRSFWLNRPEEYRNWSFWLNRQKDTGIDQFDWTDRRIIQELIILIAQIEHRTQSFWLNRQKDTGIYHFDWTDRTQESIISIEHTDEHRNRS
jgi:hypothetical protein